MNVRGVFRVNAYRRKYFMDNFFYGGQKKMLQRHPRHGLTVGLQQYTWGVLGTWGWTQKQSASPSESCARLEPTHHRHSCHLPVFLCLQKTTQSHDWSDQPSENSRKLYVIWAATWQNQQNGCAPSEDSDQPGHPPNLIRVFAVRMKKAWVLSYPLSAQRDSDQTGRMPRLICLRWAHTFCWFCHVVAHLGFVAHSHFYETNYYRHQSRSLGSDSLSLYLADPRCYFTASSREPFNLNSISKLPGDRRANTVVVAVHLFVFVKS